MWSETKQDRDMCISLFKHWKKTPRSLTPPNNGSPRKSEFVLIFFWRDQAILPLIDISCDQNETWFLSLDKTYLSIKSKYKDGKNYFQTMLKTLTNICFQEHKDHGNVTLYV